MSLRISARRLNLNWEQLIQSIEGPPTSNIKYYDGAMQELTLPEAALTQGGLAFGPVNLLSSTIKEQLTDAPQPTPTKVTFSDLFV